MIGTARTPHMTKMMPATGRINRVFFLQDLFCTGGEYVQLGSSFPELEGPSSMAIANSTAGLMVTSICELRNLGTPDKRFSVEALLSSSFSQVSL